MQQPYADIGKHTLRQMLIHFLRGFHRLRFLDHRINDVGLPASDDLLLQEAIDAFDAILFNVLSLDRPSAGRHFIDDRYIQVAVNGQSQGSGNRRRGHHQDVGMRALRSQSQALHHAETMLLVNDRQSQFFPFTSSSISAWVPIPICTNPSAISFLSCDFSRGVAEPVSSTAT